MLVNCLVPSCNWVLPTQKGYLQGRTLVRFCLFKDDHTGDLQKRFLVGSACMSGQCRKVNVGERTKKEGKKEESKIEVFSFIFVRFVRKVDLTILYLFFC